MRVAPLLKESRIYILKGRDIAPLSFSLSRTKLPRRNLQEIRNISLRVFLRAAVVARPQVVPPRLSTMEMEENKRFIEQ